MEENPYQSPQSIQPSSRQQHAQVPFLVRLFLSNWTGAAMLLFMLVNGFIAAASDRVVQPYTNLVFVGLAMNALWLGAHAMTTFWLRAKLRRRIR